MDNQPDYGNRKLYPGLKSRKGREKGRGPFAKPSRAPKRVTKGLRSQAERVARARVLAVEPMYAGHERYREARQTRIERDRKIEKMIPDILREYGV